jgi:hypothetical protein
MSKEKDKIIVETPANRLETVIIKYFRTQQEVADLLEVTSGTLNGYVTGRHTLTKKFSMRLQNAAGISAKYLLEGTGTMMLDKNVKALLEGDVPHISDTDTKITKLGIIKQFVLQDEGSHQSFNPNGEGSVVDFVLGDLKENSLPFRVLQSSKKFAEKYGIAVNTSLILKKDCLEGDWVLFTTNNRQYKVGIFNKDKVIEIKTEPKNIYQTDEITIKGRIVGRFEFSICDEKTGNIF